MNCVCPYCGAEVDCDAAPDSAAPGTMLCPACQQQIDRPAAPEPAAAAPEPDPAPEPTPAPQPEASPAPPPPPPAPEAMPLPACDGMATLAEQLGKTPPEAPAEPELSPLAPAWEGGGNFLAALWRTTWQVLGHPVRTLGAAGRPGLVWPLSYGLILGSLGAGAQIFWRQLLGWGAVPTRKAMISLVLTPLEVAVALFVLAALIHAMLFVLGGAKQGYRATFRVAGYCQASSIFGLIPGLGPPVQVVWGLVVLVAGLAAAHGIGKGRAFFALVLPLALVLLVLVLLAVVFGLGAIMATMGASDRLIPGL